MFSLVFPCAVAVSICTLTLSPVTVTKKQTLKFRNQLALSFQFITSYIHGSLRMYKLIVLSVLSLLKFYCLKFYCRDSQFIKVRVNYIKRCRQYQVTDIIKKRHSELSDPVFYGLESAVVALQLVGD